MREFLFYRLLSIFVLCSYATSLVALRDVSMRALHQDVSPTVKVSGTCICIFDFDHTLRVQNETGWDTGSKDSKGIVRKCKEFGYEVALASANCDIQKMKLVLPNRIDADIFSPRWFESPAFQHCDAYKTNELTKILEFFKTEPSCAMFFDDLAYNVEKYGRDVGVHWRHVNPEYGVTWDDFWSLVPKLKDNCDCQLPTIEALSNSP